jgi:hypothetical protein
LQKAHLTTIEHNNLQASILVDNKRRIVLRRSVFKGGGLLIINTLYARIKERNEKENIERLRKARKKLNQAKNKQVSHSLTLRIQVLVKNKQLKNLLALGI